MEAILNASNPNAFPLDMYEPVDSDESKPNLYDVQDSAGVDKYLADIANQKNIS